MMDHSISSEIDEILDSEAGQDAVLTTASGAHNIRCILRNPYAQAVVISQGWEGSVPTAECKSSDVADAVQGNTLVTGGVTYKINERHPEDSGWTILTLYKEV